MKNSICMANLEAVVWNISSSKISLFLRSEPTIHPAYLHIWGVGNGRTFTICCDTKRKANLVKYVQQAKMV